MQPTEFIHSSHFPQQTLKKLSFCESNKPQKLKLWISQLRVTQIMPTAIILYRYAPEINQLKCDARTRFLMLELIRPTIQDILCGLAKFFLNQPIALPEEAKKKLLIAQALQKTLIDGYLLCLQDVIDKNQINDKKTKHSAFFTLALHRAITSIGQFFLRCYQLYMSPPKSLWRQLHSLFLLADNTNILDIIIDDPTVHRQTTLRAAYSHVLILALSRPNQLGQKDLKMVSCSAESWSSYLRYHRALTENPTNFLYVDLESDKPPEKKSTTLNEKKYVIELDFTLLLDEIEREQYKTDLSTTLRHHLIDCWSKLPHRTQERHNTKGVADMCVGLRDLHQAVCNFDSLENLVENSTDKEDISGQNINELSLDNAVPENTITSDARYHTVSIQNLNSGGYCILCPNNIQTRFDSGEIIGIRDNDHPTWLCCVIRWVRQGKQGAQLGIQILSDNPQAFAAAQIYDTGGHADYTRALYLPASDINDMQATLITATTPFQESRQIKVAEGKKEQTWLLQQLLFATRNLQQFTFKEMS